MPEFPSPPIFWYSLSRGARFGMDRAVSGTERYTQLGLLGDWDEKVLYYDSDGQVWSRIGQRPPMRRGWLSKLVAQFYNPSIEVSVTWTHLRSYPFEELVRAYIEAIEQDDDILTQFREGDEIIHRIRGCATFNDLVDVWDWARTEDDSESAED